MAKQHLSAPAQMCFLSFSDQRDFLRFYDRGNVSPNVGRMKCSD